VDQKTRIGQQLFEKPEQNAHDHAKEQSGASEDRANQAEESYASLKEGSRFGTGKVGAAAHRCLPMVLTSQAVAAAEQPARNGEHDRERDEDDSCACDGRYIGDPEEPISKPIDHVEKGIESADGIPRLG